MDIYRLLTGCLLTAVIISSNIATADQLIVAAANSTCTSLEKIAESFRRQHAVDVELICKSSGRLAKGLTGSSIQADIFISANQKWIEYANVNGIVVMDSITTLWGNTLVVAAPMPSTLEITSLSDLAGSNVKTVIIGDPGTAPFGRYAKQAMKACDIWDKIRSKVNTRKHISLAASTLGKADKNTVGILYVTNIDNSLKILYTINESLHDPIRYYAALTTKGNDNPNAELFLHFLSGYETNDIIKDAGFKVLDE